MSPAKLLPNLSASLYENTPIARDGGFTALTLHRETFDCVIVAIDDEKIAHEVMENVKSLGVPEEKLIWQNYRRCDYEETEAAQAVRE